MATSRTGAGQARKYELKARAESQRETHDRIAEAAAKLHEEKGPAATTVAEIARRAGVTRLTVYNHFPDLASLLPACSAHYEGRHPAPDFGGALALTDPAERIHASLVLLYGWWGETESMWSKVLADRVSTPEVDAFVAEGLDRMLDGLADDLAGPGAPARRRTVLRLAVDFWTWRRLRAEGHDDEAAAALLADLVEGCARQ